MAVLTHRKGTVRRLGSSRKVPKSYRLTASKLDAARRILGAATATEAIETALDMVVFRQDLVEGTRAMLGIRLRDSENP